MKLAVMSDIHSNLIAFDMAISDAQERGTNRFIFCGDYISDAPDTTRILQRIQSLPCWTIRGNREDYMINHSAEGTSWDGSLQHESLNWTYNHLSPKDMAFIKTLPPTMHIEDNPYSILVSHGSPYKARDDINPARSTEPLDKMIQDFTEDIFIFGHSHLQWQYEYRDRHFINPGSVGIPSQNKCFQYALLDIDSKVSCELISLPYDLVRMEDYYQTYGFVGDIGIWGRIFINTLRTGNNLTGPFFRFLGEYTSSKGISLGEIIPNPIFVEATKLWETDHQL